MSNNDKIDLEAINQSANEEFNEFMQAGVHEALVEFASQAQIYFPQILDDERDQAAAKIHIDNLQDIISRTNKFNSQTSKQDSEKVITALTSLSKIGDQKQDDMMACALLDYIDEILELLSEQT